MVLQIEDNPSNFAVVEAILEQRPQVSLMTAIQGRIGLELAQQHRPDLILLDLHLPDLRGDEVLRRLKGDPATRAIPVVMVSADATHGQAERLLAAGAHAYITKPIDLRRFLQLVDDVLLEPAVEAHERRVS
jgi:CheY-like chemotaxis protein